MWVITQCRRVEHNGGSLINEKSTQFICSKTSNRRVEARDGREEVEDLKKRAENRKRRVDSLLQNWNS